MPQTFEYRSKKKQNIAGLEILTKEKSTRDQLPSAEFPASKTVYWGVFCSVLKGSWSGRASVDKGGRGGGRWGAQVKPHESRLLCLSKALRHTSHHTAQEARNSRPNKCVGKRRPLRNFTALFTQHLATFLFFAFFQPQSTRRHA